MACSRYRRGPASIISQIFLHESHGVQQCLLIVHDLSLEDWHALEMFVKPHRVVLHIILSLLNQFDDFFPSRFRSLIHLLMLASVLHGLFTPAKAC